MRLRHVSTGRRNWFKRAGPDIMFLFHCVLEVRKEFFEDMIGVLLAILSVFPRDLCQALLQLFEC